MNLKFLTPEQAIAEPTKPLTDRQLEKLTEIPIASWKTRNENKPNRAARRNMKCHRPNVWSKRFTRKEHMKFCNGIAQSKLRIAR